MRDLAKDKFKENRLTRIQNKKIRIKGAGVKISPNERFKQGIKYGFQAMYSKDYRKILRYDNKNIHKGFRHHKHIFNIRGKEKEIRELDLKPTALDDLKIIVELLENEVKQIVKRRND